jgi:hypothetical protein
LLPLVAPFTQIWLSLKLAFLIRSGPAIVPSLI